MATRIFLLCTWMVYACAHDVHKRMTVEELRNTFHVDSHDLVPEYEVVHIHHISPRSIDSGGGGNKFSGGDKSSSNKIVQSGKTSAHSKISEGDLRTHRAELRLKAFGEPMNLSLVKTEGLIKKKGLKVWTVEPNATAQHGVEYVELPQTNDDIGDIYQDEDNEAAILLRNDENNGELLVEGSIGTSFVIRPIPSRLRLPPPSPLPPTTPPTSSTEEQTLVVDDDEDSSDDEMYLDQDDEGAEVHIDTGLPIRRRRVTKLAPHVVIKRRGGEEDEQFGDYALMEPDHLAKRYRRRRSPSTPQTNSTKSRSKREAPYIIYPEILVIVDYDGYRLHDGDNVKIKRYFVSFWNGVDLRYKLLKGPKIRISIAGIIISRGRDATPYLEKNRVGRDAIDSAAALTDMGKYLFRERRLPVYDIAVAITKYDMCRRRKGGRCTKGTAGFAYVGGACVVNKRLEKVNSVAIIEDTGGFSGIIVAAHEVGHLLGAVHDGSPPPSYLGGPGAEKCRWEDGFIMSDLRHTERGFRWSPCSVASFHHFLNGDTATCLYNAPHEDDSLPRVLPGKLLSLDAQCRKDRGTSACFTRGPGAEKCRWEDGFIMSDLRHTERGFRWSPCSVASFHHFLNGDTATCLYNAPHEDDSLPRVLPGKLLSLDAQCRKDRGTSACFTRRPGAEKCRWEDGFIMSDLRHTKRGFRWSPCSVASFHHFLNGDTATCLYNAPHADDSLPRVLPGKLLSLDAQCRKDRGTSACFKDDRVCAQLFCFDAGSGYCVAYRPAAEGSPCGDGQYCLNGRCVAEHENIIPDYSQNTPSYIRRQDTPQGRPLFADEEEEVPADPVYQQYTTQPPYSYHQQEQTTEPPYNNQQYYTTPRQYYTTTTQSNYYTTQTTRQYQYYTTSKPVFSFGRQTYTTQRPQSQYYTTKATTRNPYIGDYYNLRSKTTKSPYDFANFGRTTKSPYYNDEVNNNYLKRSYNSASYFGASNRHNVTVNSTTRRY